MPTRLYESKANTMTLDNNDEDYFPLFAEMLKNSQKLSQKCYSLIDQDESEERNDVRVYQTLRYPSGTRVPTAS